MPFFLKRLYTELVYPKLPTYELYQSVVKNKRGIEIGGPTKFFTQSGFLPLYPHLESLDNINFSSETIWEGRLADRGIFHFDGREGVQFVREASELIGISDSAYDVVLSSHVIEHCANPIKTLIEWKRVLRKMGYLVMIVPHKEGTFDRLRDVTFIEHLVDDFRNNTDETDLTHAEEFINRFDFSLHPHEPRDQFVNDMYNNAKKRRIHHHAFNTPLVAQLLQHSGWQIISIDIRLPFHIICLAQKTDGIDNSAFLASTAAYKSETPFRTDK